MNQKEIETQIKNYKIREGPLYKRSKFLKEWRERWIVLTMNYIFTFTNKSCQEITDVVDLKEVKSYKSYLRKDEEMIPVGFKLRTGDDMFYFCARNCNEKWTWIVSLERLMDYKYVGASTYNNVDLIRTKGFESQQEFENGGKVEKDQAKFLLEEKTETKTDVNEEAEKIKKALQRQQEEFKKTEEKLRQEIEQLNKKKETPPPPPKEQPKKQVKEQPPPPKQSGGGLVANLTKQFEQKMEESSKQTIPQYKLPQKAQNSRVYGKPDTKALSVSRSKIVSGLFDELYPNAEIAYGFKYFIDFLVKIGADKELGYSSYVVYESKTHENRLTFAEVFIELLTDYKDYENCTAICRFIQTCIFESPGLFNPIQNRNIKKKLLEFFSAVSAEDKLEVIIKNMYIMHKIEKYEKNNELTTKLERLVKEAKKEETRNWAKKLRDDL